MFKLLTSAKESLTAFNAFKATMGNGARRLNDVQLGWPGGSLKVAVDWHSRLNLWSHFYRNVELGRYWCCFGEAEPQEGKNLSITVEINPPLSGRNPRVAGAFVVGPDDQIYLAHSGKVGGGRKGIGKTQFINFYRGGNWQEVLSPGSNTMSMIILGRVTGAELLPAIAQFTHEVARFKRAAQTGNIQTLDSESDYSFDPEFEGIKTYPLGGEVEAQCFHGTVVSNLAEILDRRGLITANDKARDLFILKKSKIEMLFEVKTNLSSTSIYGAVGQLMLHTAHEDKTFRKVIVIPGNLPKKTETALQKLGIEILRYQWKKDCAYFEGLDEVIADYLI